MARFTRMQVLNTVYATGVLPLYYHADLEVMKNVATACWQGGLGLLEFTNRGDRAFEVFIELEKYCASALPGLVTGAGTVLDAPTASLYINSGASFIVGPNLNPEVARLCHRRRVPYIAGCATISEISQAEELGCEIVKIFPAQQLGGPAFVKAVLGPCPGTALMATGGISLSEECLTAYFQAGAICVGVGSNLFTDDLIRKKDFLALTEKIRDVIHLIKKIKNK